jgi:hypothetical protein
MVFVNGNTQNIDPNISDSEELGKRLAAET